MFCFSFCLFLFCSVFCFPWPLFVCLSCLSFSSFMNFGEDKCLLLDNPCLYCQCISRDHQGAGLVMMKRPHWRFDACPEWLPRQQTSWSCSRREECSGVHSIITRLFSLIGTLQALYQQPPGSVVRFFTFLHSEGQTSTRPSWVIFFRKKKLH